MKSNKVKVTSKLEYKSDIYDVYSHIEFYGKGRLKRKSKYYEVRPIRMVRPARNLFGLSKIKLDKKYSESAFVKTAEEAELIFIDCNMKHL